MKKFSTLIVVLTVFLYVNIPLVYSQVPVASANMQTKEVDVDKDGDSDVTYYHDGKNVNRAEADTNEDGRSDITVHAEDGKFKSAEVDTDYDGKTDKTFSDTAAFNRWLNEHNPEYKNYLGWSDWTYQLHKF